jgi:hypothetical protein
MFDFIEACFAALIVLMCAGLMYRVFIWAFGWVTEEDSPPPQPDRDTPPTEYRCCVCGSRDYRIVSLGKPYCYACAEKEGVLQ